MKVYRQTSKNQQKSNSERVRGTCTISRIAFLLFFGLLFSFYIIVVSTPKEKKGIIKNVCIRHIGNELNYHVCRRRVPLTLSILPIRKVFQIINPS